jgi:hypothetical protein
MQIIRSFPYLKRKKEHGFLLDIPTFETQDRITEGKSHLKSLHLPTAKIYSLSQTLNSVFGLPEFATIRRLISLHEQWQIFLWDHFLLSDLTSIVLSYLGQEKVLTLHRTEGSPSILNLGCHLFLWKFVQWYSGKSHITLYELLVMVQDHFDPSEYAFHSLANYSYGVVCSFKNRVEAGKSGNSLFFRFSPGDELCYSANSMPIFTEELDPGSALGDSSYHVMSRAWSPYPLRAISQSLLQYI